MNASPVRRAFGFELHKVLCHVAALTMLQSLSSPAFSQTPVGWKTTQEVHKACQISLPPAWTLTFEGQATMPGGGEAVLVIGSDRPLQPLAPDMQKLLRVDRMIDNSSQRVFYVMKRQGDVLEYIIDQQFKTGRCKLQLSVPKAYSEADVLKIIATMASIR